MDILWILSSRLQPPGGSSGPCPMVDRSSEVASSSLKLLMTHSGLKAKSWACCWPSVERGQWSAESPLSDVHDVAASQVKRSRDWQYRVPNASKIQQWALFTIGDQDSLVTQASAHPFHTSDHLAHIFSPSCLPCFSYGRASIQRLLFLPREPKAFAK